MEQTLQALVLSTPYWGWRLKKLQVIIPASIYFDSTLHMHSAHGRLQGLHKTSQNPFQFAWHDAVNTCPLPICRSQFVTQFVEKRRPFSVTKAAETPSQLDVPRMAFSTTSVAACFVLKTADRLENASKMENLSKYP